MHIIATGGNSTSEELREFAIEQAEEAVKHYDDAAARIAEFMAKAMTKEFGNYWGAFAYVKGYKEAVGVYFWYRDDNWLQLTNEAIVIDVWKNA